MKENEQKLLWDLLKKYERYLEETPEIIGYSRRYSRETIDIRSLGKTLTSIDEVIKMLGLTSEFEEKRYAEEISLEEAIERIRNVSESEEAYKLGFLERSLQSGRTFIWVHKTLPLKVLLNDSGNGYVAFEGFID